MNNMKNKIVLSLLFAFFGALGNNAMGKVEVYPMAEGISRSALFEIEVFDSGEYLDSPVYTEMAQWKTNRCKTTSWTSFATDTMPKLRIKTRTYKAGSCRVLPRRHNIDCKVLNDSVVELQLPGPGQYSIEFETGVVIEHPLLVFVDNYPLDRPSPDTPDMVVFKTGIHEIGDNYRLKSNQTVYLEPGAYVKVQFVAENEENITIMGQGILSGEEYPARSHNHMITLHNCNNVLVEGITVINAPRFCVSLTGYNHICRNLKMMGWWFSTDGIGIGSNSLVEDCFFKVNDDAIKLYRSNTVARRCVIWQMENGAPFQIGWNMPGYNSNFHVYDIDIIRVEHPWDNPNEAVFDAIHGCSGVMTDYLYEDIRIDNCEHRLFHIMTRPNRFGSWDPEKGEVRNLMFRNIECYTIPKMRNIIMGHDTLHKVKNVVFDNIKVGGEVWKDIKDANLITNRRTTEKLVIK